MQRFLLSLIVALYCSLCFCGTGSAENWPRWRGPEANGVAAEGDYPSEFSAEENVSWKVELPGKGSSTPVIWEDKIFVTCPIDGLDGLLAYNFAGNELWRQTFGAEREGKHPNGTGSNPSPVTDGENIVVYYKSGAIACIDLSGKVLWETNLQEKYGPDTLWWDLGTSPVLAAGNAVVAVMQDGNSYLVALSLEDGKVAWKQERIYECAKESDQSYTTPSVIRSGGREVVVTWGADHLTGHDAATGELIWECGGFNPENKIMWRTIASATVNEELAIVPYGRGKFLTAINLRDASGDITDSNRLWEKSEIGCDVPTPILNGDQIILLSDTKGSSKGKIFCLDKNTGEQLWEAELPRARANYFASPVLAGDTLYCTREDGIIVSCKVKSGVQDIVEHDMGESVIATPIPIQSKLLVRGESHLFLIGK